MHVQGPNNDVLFYVARHGETVWNAIKRIQGQLSYYVEADGTKVAVTLTEKGRDQAARLGVKLRTINFTRCYSSDLLRAVDTAIIVTKDRNLPINQDALLRERSRGKWEGKFETEFAAAPAEEKNDVESDESMCGRLFSFFKDAAQANPGGTVLVIAHERVVTNLAVQILNLPCRANDIPVDHTGLLQIRYRDGNMNVEGMEGISIPAGAASPKNKLI